MGDTGSKCIAKASVGEIDPQRMSQKNIFLSQKSNMVMMNLYQKLGSPENSSLYKVGHMGANGSKCIAKASLVEIDPYRVSQKTCFSQKV
jgi:hypothetical protein